MMKPLWRNIWQIHKMLNGHLGLFWPRWNSPILPRSFFKNLGHNTINKYLKSLKAVMWGTRQGWVPWNYLFCLPYTQTGHWGSLQPEPSIGMNNNNSKKSLFTLVKEPGKRQLNRAEKLFDNTYCTRAKYQYNIQYSVHLTHSTHSMVLAEMSWEPILPPAHWIMVAMIC